MRLKTVFIVLLLALTASGAALGAGKLSDKALIAKAISAVRNTLKDPESAKFRNVHVKKGSGAAVQGEVNAKNSYGGYIGFDRFYFDNDNKVVFRG